MISRYGIDTLMLIALATSGMARRVSSHHPETFRSCNRFTNMAVSGHRTISNASRTEPSYGGLMSGET
jgi:hypothetical protein